MTSSFSTDDLILLKCKEDQEQGLEYLPDSRDCSLQEAAGHTQKDC